MNVGLGREKWMLASNGTGIRRQCGCPCHVLHNGESLTVSFTFVLVMPESVTTAKCDVGNGTNRFVALF